MKIELHEIPVREVAEGYVDSAENGVRGYGGRQTVAENCQMLCADCNRRKSDI